MEKIDLNEYLASNEYPGRGICGGKGPGRHDRCFIGLLHHGPQREQPQPRVRPCAEAAAASAPWQSTPPSWRTPA